MSFSCRFLLSAVLLCLATPMLSADDGLPYAGTALRSNSADGPNTWTNTFPTVPGRAYIFTFSLSQQSPVPNQAIEAVIGSASGTPLDTQYAVPLSGSILHTATYLALDNSTTLTLNGVFSGTTAVTVNVLSIGVIPIQDYQHPGHYVGTVVEGRSFPGDSAKENFGSTETRRANLRINSAGQILIILEPGDEFATATVNNDGVTTYGGSDSIHGTASYKGGVMRLSFEFTEHLTDNFNGIRTKRTREYVVRRVGN